MVAAGMERFGHIDVLVNNAAVLVAKDVVATELDEWERVFAVNVRGVYLCCKHVLPGMLARGSGYLLNTASAAGLLASLNSMPYGVTKNAAIALADEHDRSLDALAFDLDREVDPIGRRGRGLDPCGARLFLRQQRIEESLDLLFLRAIDRRPREIDPSRPREQ